MNRGTRSRSCGLSMLGFATLLALALRQLEILYVPWWFIIALCALAWGVPIAVIFFAAITHSLRRR